MRIAGLLRSSICTRGPTRYTPRVRDRSLPIYEIEAELTDGLRRLRRAIVSAPTGSGKSTQVPQMLVDRGLAGDGMVIVLQPRRIAARLLAARVARERATRLGAEVGYQIRFDDVSSPATRIHYVTEGILLRRMLGAPDLRGVSAVVFDEFHERHLYSDLSLALALQVQKTSRPDLLILVMSATLDVDLVRRYLDPCAVVQAQGRMYPIATEHIERPDDPARTPPWDAAAREFARAIDAGVPGDALIFMPGTYEIGRTIQAVRACPQARGFAVLPLYGELSAEAQDAAVAPSAQRKVVVATNVAETSLTIPGVRIVIDSGLARVARFDPYRGINTLLVEKISRASADQRAGRAGRTAPGVCLRLWTREEHEGRAAADDPEIRRMDLAEALLTLKAAGVADAALFPWLEPPDARLLQRAETLLRDLEAARPGDGALTPLGRRMLSFPAHPRYARMLIAAADHGCVRTAALLAALTQARTLLQRRPDAITSDQRDRVLGDETESDFLLLLRAWRHARDTGFALDACRDLGIHALTARQIEPAYEHFLRIAAAEGLPVEDEIEAPAEAIARCVLTGFPDHFARLIDLGTLRCQIVHGRTGELARDSVVRKSRFVVAAEIREVEGRGRDLNVLLSLATAVRKEWLQELFPQHLHSEQVVFFDAETKRVFTDTREMFHDLVLENRRGDRPPLPAAAVLLADEVVKGTLVLKQWDHAVEQWIVRVNCLHRWCPDLDLPAVTDADRRSLIEQVCLGCVSYKEIKDRAVWPVVRAWLSPQQQASLDRHAPERLDFSNGRRVKIAYAPDAPPHIAMRIQELYDVQGPLKIAMGRVPLVVHILGPNHRPVQVTQDLESFWREMYPKVKQELQRKYPRHEWR